MDRTHHGSGVGASLVIKKRFELPELEPVSDLAMDAERFADMITETGRIVRPHVRKEFLPHVGSMGVQEARLVRVSHFMLKCRVGEPYAEVCRRAVERGYGICTARLALRLARAYREQPKNETLIIPIEGVGAINSSPKIDIITLVHDRDGQWVCYLRDRAAGISTGEELVFIAPKEE